MDSTCGVFSQDILGQAVMIPYCFPTLVYMTKFFFICMIDDVDDLGYFGYLNVAGRSGEKRTGSMACQLGGRGYRRIRRRRRRRRRKVLDFAVTS